MMQKLINFIPPEYRVGALIIALIVLVSSSFGAGWTVNGWKLGKEMQKWQADLAESKAEAQKQAREVERLSADLSTANAAEFEARRQAQEARGRVITKEVIKYVQADYAGKCNLPTSWVRIDTHSATGMPGDESSWSGADGSPSGITDSEAIQVISERNRICRAEIEKLRSLQDYVREQIQVFKGK